MHILLTVLGTNPQEAEYELAGKKMRSLLAPLALLDLLPEEKKPDRVIALCTRDAAAQSWPLLEEALKRKDVPVACVNVPDGVLQGDIEEFLRVVSRAIPAGEDVSLTTDVTHGFRHFSFLTYAAVLYLSALREVTIQGAYYGLFRKGDASPFLDLGPLLQLPRWFHALQSWNETGSAASIAKELSHDQKQLAKELRQISEAYESGLPLEIGRETHNFLQQRLKNFRRVLRDRGLPLAEELTSKLEELLKPFRLENLKESPWKKKAPLHREELTRQAAFVRDLYEKGNLATALGLMNEWTVSWAALQLGLQDEWLDFVACRRKAAGVLGAIAELASNEPAFLSEEQARLGVFWRSLGELRNAFHHHGMRPQVLIGGGSEKVSKDLERVYGYWRLLSGCPSVSLRIGESQTRNLLITPLGQRPGVLFSALRATEQRLHAPPDACIVICSAQTEALATEALQRAGFAGRHHPLKLEDPYGGLKELPGLGKQVRAILVGADHVTVNITGGTTLMGLAAEAIANEARKLARPVSRFGLIDRRPLAEQEADPYQAGESFWLDDEGTRGES